jgi:hypothetical protein
MNSAWIQNQSTYAPGVSEIKIRGTPWLASGTTTMMARELLLCLLEALDQEGWSVYASIDQKTRSSNNSNEMDTVSLSA